MNVSDIQTVSIIGSGVMGHGIALVVASNGLTAQLYDRSPEALQRAQKAIQQYTDNSVAKGKLTAEDQQALLQRIVFTSDFTALNGLMAVEAIFEDLQVKHELFLQLEAQLPANAILATNTSSIPVTQIATVLSNPERCIGWHFFNPAPLMKLVEVIAGVRTSPEVVETTLQFTRQLGKVPALAQDTPGFIVNRIARFFYLESLNILEEGVANIETIDALMENAGFKMGPFKLMDLIGVETNHEVTKSLYHSFFQAPRFRPSRIQQKKVEAKLFGKKTGEGFYKYA
jgi:3-hydroxybutyryl-CoA dehydrogenase